MFRIAWRHQLIRPKCLAASLAQQAFLMRFGRPGVWRIGVKKEGERLHAHAWVEAGAPAGAGFHPLSTWPP